MLIKQGTDIAAEDGAENLISSYSPHIKITMQTVKTYILQPRLNVLISCKSYVIEFVARKFHETYHRYLCWYGSGSKLTTRIKKTFIKLTDHKLFPSGKGRKNQSYVFTSHDVKIYKETDQATLQ